MSVNIEVQMRVNIMYNFLVHHTYTSINGIFSTISGFFFVYFGVQYMEAGNTQSMMVYYILGFLFVIGNPIILYSKAKRQVKNTPMFQKPITYELTNEGIVVSQEDQASELAWDEVMKVTASSSSLIIYLSKVRALILPKADFGEQYATAVQLISTHVPPKKVKIRTMG